MILNILFFILFQQPDITLYFFYSPDCGHCKDVMLEDLPGIESKFNVNIKKFNLDDIKNLQLLENIEKRLKKSGEDLPVIVIGDSVFYGPEEIHKKLEPTLRTIKKARCTISRDTTVIDTIKKHFNPINLYYFFKPGCRQCRRTEILLKDLEKEYKYLSIHRYDILESKNKVFYEGLARHLRMPEDLRLLVPAIFIGDDYLIKKDINTGNLINLFKKYQNGSPALDSLDLSNAGQGIIKRFSRFSFLGIMLAGLIDGVNPCAFATIIFFISYLLFVGRRQKDILLMAISFISAVFCSYLLIGFGVYNLLIFLTEFEFIGKIIYLIFGVGAIVLGILSLYDYILARRKSYNNMLLQLPRILKQAIHKKIKEKSAVGGIIVGSLIAGFFISVLEFACTGQIYLPTITFMISRPGLKFRPILALIVYNIMFIVPLILIAILALIFSTENIARSLSDRIALIKLLTAVLFFGLGILLLLSI